MTPLGDICQGHVRDAVRRVWADSALMLDGSMRQAMIEAVDAELLRLALHYHNGIQLRAARTLGLNRNTMRKLMREHGISAR